jgi:hypothetical protein
MIGNHREPTKNGWTILQILKIWAWFCCKISDLERLAYKCSSVEAADITILIPFLESSYLLSGSGELLLHDPQQMVTLWPHFSGPQSNSSSVLPDSAHLTVSSQQQWLADVRIPWSATLCASCPGWHRPPMTRSSSIWTKCLKWPHIP